MSGDNQTEGRRLLAIKSGLSQFRHGQSPDSVSDWKTVRRAADDSSAGNPRLAHYVASGKRLLACPHRAPAAAPGAAFAGGTG